MSKSRAGLVAIAALAVLLAALYVFSSPSENPPPAGLPEEGATAADLGITYLTITPQVASYYGLEETSGVLVTEVAPGSPAATAGVQAGDVILSYNGVRLEGVPLLGMMRACPVGSQVAMEVRRGDSTSTLEMLHTGRPGSMMANY